MSLKRSYPASSSEDAPSTSQMLGGDESVLDSSVASTSYVSPCKKFVSTHDIIKFTNIRSMNEMDKSTLQFQNKKLYDCLVEKRHEVTALRERVEQLEQRQTKDDELLCLVNRYWNQLDEDCFLLLKRLDQDVDGSEDEVSSNTDNFLKQLSSWDNDEIEKRFRDRVHFSKRIVSKVLLHCDKVQTRIDRLRHRLKANEADEETPSSVAQLDELLKEEVRTLNSENRRMQHLTTDLHKKVHTTSLKLAELQDQVQLSSEKAAEWEAKCNDMEYKLSETLSKLYRLDQRLADSQTCRKELEEKLSTLQGSSGSPDGTSGSAGGTVSSSSGGGAVASSKFNEIATELEEVKELAQNRLNELEYMQKTLEERTEECERLKAQLQEVPEQVILDSVPYKSVKEQFNILYNEASVIRQVLQESRQSMLAIRQAHQNQINDMRANENMIQNQMRSEMFHLQEQYAILRRDFEAMEVDLRQTQAQNEQAQPLHSEMRDLISHLQVQHRQAKSESARNMKKVKDMEEEITKLTEEKKRLEGQVDAKEDELEKMRLEFAAGGKDTPGTSTGTTKTSTETVQQLRAELQKSQDAQREMKVLLDMYKVIPKEQRDRVNLLKAEQKLTKEVEQLRAELKQYKEPLDSKNVSAVNLRPEHYHRMQQELKSAQTKLETAKQESEAVLKELEMTGQAFEDVQEQNTRLLQMLREKEDANLKLVSEHVKITQFHTYAKEEKIVLEEKNKLLSAQIEALNKALSKQEEKERLLLSNIATQEKEGAFRNQATEQYRRKMMESLQVAEDLRMNLQKYLSQLKETQTAVQEKASALDREAFKYHRMQEEFSTLRRRYDRLKKIEQSHNADEVLLAEIQEYKEQLTCPTCKTNRKDAILTKCFHVFCLSCLKKRYEMRNRKCPKCNATFGANDYHRIYLS